MGAATGPTGWWHGSGHFRGRGVSNRGTYWAGHAAAGAGRYPALHWGDSVQDVPSAASGERRRSDARRHRSTLAREDPAPAPDVCRAQASGRADGRRRRRRAPEGVRSALVTTFYAPGGRPAAAAGQIRRPFPGHAEFSDLPSRLPAWGLARRVSAVSMCRDDAETEPSRPSERGRRERANPDRISANRAAQDKGELTPIPDLSARFRTT